MRIKIQTNAKMVRKGLEDLTKELPRIGRQTMYDALLRVQKRLKQPGKPITYPVKWDSLKQRRDFFATNGFGRGIPLSRTGGYQKGYMIRRLPNGHELEKSPPRMPSMSAGMRDGGRQSSIHDGPLAADA